MASDPKMPDINEIISEQESNITDDELKLKLNKAIAALESGLKKRIAANEDSDIETTIANWLAREQQKMVLEKERLRQELSRPEAEQDTQAIDRAKQGIRNLQIALAVEELLISDWKGGNAPALEKLRTTLEAHRAELKKNAQELHQDSATVFINSMAKEAQQALDGDTDFDAEAFLKQCKEVMEEDKEEAKLEVHRTKDTPAAGAAQKKLMEITRNIAALQEAAQQWASSELRTALVNAKRVRAIKADLQRRFNEAERLNTPFDPEQVLVDLYEKPFQGANIPRDQINAILSSLRSWLSRTSIRKRGDEPAPRAAPARSAPSAPAAARAPTPRAPSPPTLEARRPEEKKEELPFILDVKMIELKNRPGVTQRSLVKVMVDAAGNPTGEEHPITKFRLPESVYRLNLTDADDQQRIKVFAAEILPYIAIVEGRKTPWTLAVDPNNRKKIAVEIQGRNQATGASFPLRATIEVGSDVDPEWEKLMSAFSSGGAIDYAAREAFYEWLNKTVRNEARKNFYRDLEQKIKEWEADAANPPPWSKLAPTPAARPAPPAAGTPAAPLTARPPAPQPKPEPEEETEGEKPKKTEQPSTGYAWNWRADNPEDPTELVGYLTKPGELIKNAKPTEFKIAIPEKLKKMFQGPEEKETLAAVAKRLLEQLTVILRAKLYLLNKKNLDAPFFTIPSELKGAKIPLTASELAQSNSSWVPKGLLEGLKKEDEVILPGSTWSKWIETELPETVVTLMEELWKGIKEDRQLLALKEQWEPIAKAAKSDFAELYKKRIAEKKETPAAAPAAAAGDTPAEAQGERAPEQYFTPQEQLTWSVGGQVFTDWKFLRVGESGKALIERRPTGLPKIWRTVSLAELQSMNPKISIGDRVCFAPPDRALEDDWMVDGFKFDQARDDLIVMLHKEGFPDVEESTTLQDLRADNTPVVEGELVAITEGGRKEYKVVKFEIAEGQKIVLLMKVDASGKIIDADEIIPMHSSTVRMINPVKQSEAARQRGEERKRGEAEAKRQAHVVKIKEFVAKNFQKYLGQATAARVANPEEHVWNLFVQYANDPTRKEVGLAPITKDDLK